MMALSYQVPTSAPYLVWGDQVVIVPSDPSPHLQPVAYEQDLRPETASVVPLHDRKERMKARFRLLRRLPENHDNEGAARPNVKTVDAAIAFIDRMRSYPEFFVTLDDDGSAVIEFRRPNLFGDITFFEDGHVECYARPSQGASSLTEGDLNSGNMKAFLEHHFHVALV
ncbi:MAG: hypothetical protein ACR2K5_06680 [Pseudolabrys sp.]